MNFKAIILLIIGVWLGILIGISFVEAPLKFTAPGITTKLGVGIGRLVFNASNKIQLGLFLMVIGYYLWNYFKFNFSFPWILILITILLGVQTLYLLPVLDERAVQLLNDQPREDSFHHVGYIVTEVFKAIFLIMLFDKTYKMPMMAEPENIPAT